MDTVSKSFKVTSHLILVIFCALVVLPLLVLVSSSFTDESALITQGYNFLPREFSADAYRYIFGGAVDIVHTYGITIIVTAVGVAAGMTITVMIAHVLSVPELPGRRILSFLVFFTMLFNGGLVSTYLMYTGVFHIKNTIWALIIPALLVNPFLIMIARSYFASSIPREVLDAARVDGAGEIYLFVKIVLPMSVPIVATVGLMMGLAYWNNWTNGLYYITDAKLYSVQQLLNQLLMSSQGLADAASLGGDLSKALPTTALKMAVAVMGVLPVMIVYPFFQKFFIKGITMGAVKG